MNHIGNGVVLVLVVPMVGKRPEQTYHHDEERILYKGLLFVRRNDALFGEKKFFF